MRILIADDHALVRDGLRHALKALAEEVEFAAAGDTEELFGWLGQGDFQIILLDLHMPAEGS